ncbi:uncharacterized protein LOC110094826 isoform X1 [Dendrobium catenatum]|uniref:uncharacterized protein LOC110094826 isoform X1 n=1 Tax=Dendrobium catenatum TaxID=906689 RepID=UPI0009F4CF23|nr:uncharacterized protein LOC110094826 isoform X1 [Dendrobium catenatum]
MGKKAKTSPSIPAKDSAGWLWSFISIFEFSQSYNPHKLPADRKRRTARNLGACFLGNNLSKETWEKKCEDDANVDCWEDTTVLSRMPSVKKLMEEEMSKERTSKASGCSIKSNQKITKHHKNNSDNRISNLFDSDYLVLEQFKCGEPVEGSNLIFDLAALMIEFYSASRICSDMFEEIQIDLCGTLRSSGHKKHASLDESDSRLACRQFMLREALEIEAEAFLSRKIDDTKQLVGNGVIHAQEFLDALEILNSNKELFLKLVQDPNSLVFSHVQELLAPKAVEFSELEAFHSLEGSEQLEEEVGNSDQDGKRSSNQMFQKQKQPFLLEQTNNFRGEIASKTRKTSKETSKIVVLKPHLSRKHDDSTQNSPCSSPQSRYSKKHEKVVERTLSHFSFREIKSKLRYIVGESRGEHNLISKGSNSRIPFCSKVSTDRYSMPSTESSKTNVTSKIDCSSENICRSSPSHSKVDEESKVKEWQPKTEVETTQCKIQGLSLVTLFRMESLNDEAEKRYSEMTGTEYRTNNLTNTDLCKSSEKMISPSDCNLLTLQLIDGTSANLNSVPSLKDTPCLSSDLDVKMSVINAEAAMDKAIVKEEAFDREQTGTNGREENVEIEQVKSVHINPAVNCNNLYIPDDSSCESCTDGCSTSSEQGTPNEKPRILIPTASISPNTLIINQIESSEFISEKTERPSPVSVLEPFFLEDDGSPDHPSIKFDSFTTDELKRPLQPIHLNFHEDSTVVINTSDCLVAHQRTCSYDMEIMTKYVRNMLEAYSFDSEMSPERWPSSDLLLHPSHLGEIKSLQSTYPEDPNLLLDCVNEVLLEIKERRFQICPWVPILKEFIIQEVCKAIKRFLSSQVQYTINEIIMKDMGSAMWNEHRLEMECICAEMGWNIFEGLMEETIFEMFW